MTVYPDSIDSKEDVGQALLRSIEYLATRAATKADKIVLHLLESAYDVFNYESTVREENKDMRDELAAVRYSYKEVLNDIKKTTKEKTEP